MINLNLTYLNLNINKLYIDLGRIFHRLRISSLFLFFSMLEVWPHVLLHIGPYTWLKSQVIDTCIDFDNFYMVLYQNLERILLLYYVFKFEQTKIMFASNLQKTPSCFDLFVYFSFLDQMRQILYLFASESFKDFRKHVFTYA